MSPLAYCRRNNSNVGKKLCLLIVLSCMYIVQKNCSRPNRALPLVISGTILLQLLLLIKFRRRLPPGRILKSKVPICTISGRSSSKISLRRLLSFFDRNKVCPSLSERENPGVFLAQLRRLSSYHFVQCRRNWLDVPRCYFRSSGRERKKFQTQRQVEEGFFSREKQQQYCSEVKVARNNTFPSSNGRRGRCNSIVPLFSSPPLSARRHLTACKSLT